MARDAKVEDLAACRCLERVCKQPNHCWYMTDTEIGRLMQGVDRAIPTTGTRFPDFEFEGGFIEHFQVTSTVENKSEGGSEYKREMARFDARYKKEFAEFKEKAPCGEAKVFSKYHPQIDNSHDNLKASFKSNWEKHIESLNSNPKYAEQLSVFMVDYVVPMGLCMCEFAPEGSGRTSPYYRLCWDKDLLEYVQTYKDFVQYIIFVTHNAVEVIPTNQIDKLLEDLPHPFEIQAFSTSFSVTNTVLYKIPHQE